MNHFLLPRLGFSKTLALTSGLALGKLRRQTGALILLFGSVAAQAESPPATETTALRALVAQRLPKELGLELSPLCFRVTETARDCTLQGDFDGDDKADLAVVVQEKKCGRSGAGSCRRVGIAFLLGSGKREVLGAGHGRWQQVKSDAGRASPAVAVAATDFSVTTGESWFWRIWRSTQDGLKPLTGHGPKLSTPPPGLRGDGIELLAGDASIMLYRTAAGWVAYDLGY